MALGSWQRCGELCVEHSRAEAGAISHLSLLTRLAFDVRSPRWPAGGAARCRRCGSRACMPYNTYLRSAQVAHSYHSRRRAQGPARAFDPRASGLAARRSSHGLRGSRTMHLLHVRGPTRRSVHRTARRAPLGRRARTVHVLARARSTEEVLTVGPHDATHSQNKSTATAAALCSATIGANGEAREGAREVPGVPPACSRLRLPGLVGPRDWLRRGRRGLLREAPRLAPLLLPARCGGEAAGNGSPRRPAGKGSAAGRPARAPDACTAPSPPPRLLLLLPLPVDPRRRRGQRQRQLLRRLRLSSSASAS